MRCLTVRCTTTRAALSVTGMILPIKAVIRHHSAVMSQSPRLLHTLPAPAAAELVQLGSALRRARVARNESQRALAERLGIAERTLRAVEKGDPKVSAGVLVALLWAVGLGPLSAPISEQAIRAAASGAKTRARRKVQDDF
jgi:DNA-binding XRE family transcriptional regulator